MPSLIDRTSYRGQYNRESVERALVVHFGDRGDWQADGKGGYTISTAIGIVRLRTLREAAIYVNACAETKRRIARLAEEDPLR